MYGIEENNVTLFLASEEGDGAQIDFWQDEDGSHVNWRDWDGTPREAIVILLLRALQSVAEQHDRGILLVMESRWTIRLEAKEKQELKDKSSPF